MSLRIHFLRHGQTSFSRENAFCGSGLDPELTADGVEMARAFADARRAEHWDALYSSPLRRAVATARPLAEALSMDVELRDELKEIGYGAWEGQSVEAVTREYHDEYIRWLADPAWNAPTNGELAVLIARRGLSIVEEIRGRFSSGDVLVVSHKATIRVVLCGLLGIDVGRFRYRLVCPVGSVSVVEFGEQGPLLHTLADRSHLNERLRSLPGT
ncbi:MAG: histidine phosphatase family protein [Pyrinomonadaceae bacterium]